MSRLWQNTVKSVTFAPLLVILADEAQAGWCQQFSEEGYTVIQVFYPPQDSQPFTHTLETVFTSELAASTSGWGLITYGINPGDLSTLSGNLPTTSLKACVHYSPQVDVHDGLLLRYEDATYIPTVIHLSSVSGALYTSLETAIDPSNLHYALPTADFFPVTVFTYPKVPASPPFPYLAKTPALVTAGEKSSVDVYIRSATNQSYTRTLELLRRQLGPHFPLEKLWEKHTFYEFAERDAPKTMATMVAVPYVNHVATMTGGVGYEDLARFYKYHFTQANVTPPDTELITVSRTVGADRVIDEMIFKCTHTTEIDYFLPGVKPTGKPIEIAVVGVVAFRGDKLTFEHIYWDQASVLVQLGLLDPAGLPVAGVEVARKVVDPFGLPSNTLMDKWKDSEGLPIN